jgi:hypothetical protein
VKNIAHCAQADDEQAEVGLRLQRSIFAQRRRRADGYGGRADVAAERIRRAIARIARRLCLALISRRVWRRADSPGQARSDRRSTRFAR